MNSTTQEAKNFGKINCLYSFIAGVSLVFAFAPFNFWPLVFFAPLVLLSQLQKILHLKQAFALGFSFGLGLFGLGASWIYVSIYYYGHSNIITAFSLTLLFVCFMSCFYGLFSLMHVKLSKTCSSTILQLLIFSSLWILFEYLRAHFLTGFPWLLIGDSSVSSPFANLVPILGAYGVGFIFVLSSSILYARKQLSIPFIAVFFISLCSITALTGFFSWTKSNNTLTNTILVQGNIKQTTKWSASHEQKIINTYQKLSSPYWKSGNVIIWPESAITLPLPYAKPLINNLDIQTKKTNSSLILGIPKANKQKTQYYNTLLSLNKNNKNLYTKEHLVPFGEYIPMEHWLRGIMNFFNLPMSNFITRKNNNPILPAQQLLFKPAICYEIAYSDLVLNHMDKANAILTVSNDTWFGNSLGPYQHLQIAQMRALETGRYVVRVTNDGITAIINNKGKIIKSIPRFKSGILIGKIKSYIGSTPLMYYKNNFIIIIICLILLGALSKEKIKLLIRKK